MDVVPHVVLVLDVVLEAGAVALKLVAADRADEAVRAHVLCLLILRLAELTEGVDDDTKDDVQEDDDASQVNFLFTVRQFKEKVLGNKPEFRKQVITAELP